MSESGPVSVSSAEFVRRFGTWQDRAATDPVIVTHHGRARLVLLAAARYRQLLAADGAPDARADAAELRLETLLDHLDAGFVAFDRTLRIGAMNALAATYFRLRRDAALGREAGEDMPDLGRAVVRAHLARALAGGEVGLFDAPSLAYPGQWLRLQTFPFGDGAGLLFRNVTGERALRGLDEARTALDAALASHGAVGTGTLDPSATLVRADAGLAALAGRDVAALDRARLFELVAPAHRASAAAAIDAVLGGGAARAFDAAFAPADGGERPVRIALAPLRGDYAVEGASLVATPLG